VHYLVVVGGEVVLRVQKGIPHTHVQDANSSDEVAHDERISESEKKKGFKVELEEWKNV
jgi:hypothetical protein